MFSPIVNYTSTHSMSVGVYYIFLHFGRLWTFILWIVRNPAYFQLHLIKGKDKGFGEEKEKMILVASRDKVGGLKIGRKLKITPFTNGAPPTPQNLFHIQEFTMLHIYLKSHIFAFVFMTILTLSLWVPYFNVYLWLVEICIQLW